MKRCTKCLQEKPLDQFGKHKVPKDGLNWWCKPCNNRNANGYYHANKGPNKRDLKRAHYLANKAEIDAARKARKAETRKIRHQENPEKYREIKRKWVDSKPGYNAQQKAKYRSANLEKVRAYQNEATRKDRAKHPEKWRCRWAVSNAVTDGRLAPVRTRICVDCGAEATRYDHYLGYAHENRLDVQPVCSTCDGLRERARGLRKAKA